MLSDRLTKREDESVTAFTMRQVRAEILEEAALLVERHPEEPGHGYGGLMRTAQLATCKHIAAALRALALE